MFKKAILFAGALSACSLANAQMKCGTDELYNRLKAQNPQIAINEALQEQYLHDKIMVHPNNGVAMRGTANGPDTTTVYNVPVVFHLVHDYGQEYISDAVVYNEVALMNQAYSRNGDYSQVIPPYKGNIPGTNIKYIGKANIRFHLATIDPNGQPTTGITRRQSYLSNNAGDEAKFDVWPPNKYINIWIIRRFSGSHEGAAAYAYYPSAGASNPYADGVISLYDYLNRDNTIAHEVGHVLNLAHVWGNTNQPEVACGDDGVDDTPPTRGHNPNRGGSPGLCDASLASPTSAIWDTTCATGYSKLYTATEKQALYGDSTSGFINYPDTVNAQNIMDYTYCSKMFTYGQVLRMRAALTSNVGGRNNLWSETNLTATGALAPTPDLAPIADFTPNKVFTCANTLAPNGAVTFTNRSWRDTVTSNAWTFTGGNPATSTVANPASVTFTQPGWVNVSLTAGSNAGSGTITKANAVYAADPNAIPASGYYQEFNGGDVDMYPIFNYYNDNNYKWELYNGRGFYDQNCIRFKSFDPRAAYAQNNVTQTPGGLYADFFTRGFDLSSSEFTSRATLNFYTAAAYRTTNTAQMNDTLEVSYSTTCGNSWIKLGVIARTALGTKFETAEFVPGGMDDWKLQGIVLPAGAKNAKTFFRFRYKPGVDNTVASTFPGKGTGNNFYLDRLNISSSALGVNTAELAAKGVTVAPNPTNGSTMVTIKGGDNSTAQVVVMDIAGKVVYRTEVRLNEAATQVEVPAEKISVKGMYMVQVIANGNSATHKLVVY